MRSSRLVTILLIAVALVVAGVSIWVAVRPREERPASAATWICPMHPQIVSDRPGSCPICGMDLVPAARAEEAGTAEKAAHGDMPPVDANAGATSDRRPVEMEAASIRKIGARTVAVERAPFLREIRAAGRVVIDEKRLRVVTVKSGGWVEVLHANAVGESLREGQPILELYSPEWIATQRELLVALAAERPLAASSIPDIAGSAAGLVASARRRLELLDTPADRIEELERSGVVPRTMTIRSPISGTLLKRDVAQGARVEAGTPLLEVADLSRVWILASLFEYETPFVKAGDEATLTAPFLPGTELRGHVSYLYPTLDPATRTLQVRLEFENPRLALRPEMFVDVRLRCDLGERLALPEEAVMETGTRSLVFVERGTGRFEPREVRTGVRAPGRVEIVAGLSPGERVLASGNFFVDAESRIRASLESARAQESPR